jgi:hypothetical protein
MTALRVVPQRGPEYYRCPPWCEVADHDGDGPWHHAADAPGDRTAA